MYCNSYTTRLNPQSSRYSDSINTDYTEHCASLSFCLLGVVSQQENGKTVSVSNTIRLPVERKDNGAALSCEASHPVLVGQKRVRHYRLDVHCETFMIY